MNTSANNPFYIGVVEDSRTDHLMLGRCKVRVVGLHTQDKSILPTKDLPWATLMSPANTAGSSGIGTAPIGPIEGSTVMITFNDPPYNQQPIIMGCMQGIPQDEPVINDTLDIKPKFKDDISEIGRDIPTNLLEAVADQLSPFLPNLLDFFNLPDPFKMLEALKAQLNAYAAVQLHLNFPGVSLEAGFNISQGFYGNVNLPSNIGFYPSDISVYSGALDNAALSVGYGGALYGGVGNVFTDINVLVDVVINGINGAAPIISLNNLPRLFDRYPDDPSLGRPVWPPGNNYIFPQEVARFKYEVANSVGIFQQLVKKDLDWTKYATKVPTTIEEFKEWAKWWLPSPCKEMVPDKIIEFNKKYNNKEKLVVMALIKWAEECTKQGSGGQPGTSLEYTVKAPSLTAFENLSEIWGNIQGVWLDTQNGKIMGLSGPLDHHGYPAGSTTSAMVIADSVHAAIYGTNVACSTYLGIPLDQLNEHALSGRGIISTSYPAWTLISKDYELPKKLLPSPKGMFTEAGNMAVSALVSPLADITDRLLRVGPDPTNRVPEKNKVPSDNATGGKDIIPEFPPIWYDQQERRTAGIKALLAAAKKLGLKTKEQKCSLLAITGGECGWIPCAENHKWSSPDRLMDTFSSVFRGDRKLAERFANWQGAKAAFFEYVYSYTHQKGKELGNKKIGDGGKYYGRGFLQIIGRDMYERYATISGYDIVSCPGLLISNLTVSAEVAVHYFKTHVQKVIPPASSPNYFEGACTAVNGHYEREIKRKLYEFFYGIPSPESLNLHVKTALIEPPTSSDGRLGQEIASGRFPTNSANTTGFRDPNSKYPLKHLVCKPDSNALARGSTKNTIVPVKDARRTRGIRLPFGQGIIDQPASPYAAVYPFNHVTETESGHIQEFDDTPGAERIHTYHRSGTFSEIDSGGNQVNKIVGDHYTIIDNNGIISIDGKANVHVKGDINIYAQSNVNLQSEGSVHLEIGQDLDIKVARNLEISVGGQFKLWSSGGNVFHTDKKTLMFSKDEFYNFSIDRMAHISSKELALQAEKEMHIHSSKNLNLTSKLSNVNIKGYKQTNIAANTYVNLQAGLSGEPLRISEFVGVTSVDPKIETAEYDQVMRYAPISMPTAPPGNPIFHRQTGADPISDAGVADSGQKKHYETPDEYNSPGGQGAIQTEKRQEGEQNQFKGEQGTPPTGGAPPKDQQSIVLGVELENANKVDGNNIPNIDDPNYFTNDYRLSTHINLGMFLYPYGPRYHKLIAQNGLTLSEIVSNLVNLSENVIEPMVINKILPGGIGGLGRTWIITSVFRLGTGPSQHNKGMAIDFGLPPSTPNRKQKTWQLIQAVEKVIAYDQLILEYRNDDVWIHASYDAGNCRKMAFTMNNDELICSGFKLLA